MSSNRMTEGVGKKIVEALKQQSDIEIVPMNETPDTPELTNLSSLAPGSTLIDEMVIPQQETPKQTATFSINQQNSEISSPINNTIASFHQEPVMPAVEEMELPTNVEVLRQLITKIPPSVSKQTGAMIIKQTMEALGISMTNVLQEAQQIQEELNQSVRECQTSVLEHKKQINILEVKAQKYQRQFAAINDIISLFIQTN